MKYKLITTLTLSSFSALTQAQAQATQLNPIIVNADLRDISEQDITTSVKVYDSANLLDQGANHFDDVLLKTPNVNLSGQSSRARYIQIRGVGERDEYTGAPNSSVGFSLDDIDLSGIGMSASLFDIQQVEVLRGPQSTRYGQSALGGLINIKSNDPTANRENLIEASLGNYGHQELGLMTSGPISKQPDAAQYRISVFKHNSDGFYTNTTVNRKDTNNQDELTAKGKFRFFVSPQTTIDWTVLHANLNNGYDAWTLDNSRTSLSDEPGKDTQKTNATALKLAWTGAKQFNLESKTSLAQSKMLYSYDGDWAYPGYHTNVDNITIFDNAYTYANQKQRDTLSQEFVLTSKSPIFSGMTDWLLGFYGNQLKETNHTTDNYGTDLTSDYTLSKLASYGQLDSHFTNSWTLSTGARIERHQSKYQNNNSETFNPSETLWAGNLSLSKQLTPSQNAYATLARAFKAGGYNIGLPASHSNLTQFKQETALQLELGHKLAVSNKLTTRVNVFYMDRSNPQFDGYTYVGNNYVYYKENFDKAQNYGLEASLNWQPQPQYTVFADLGLLKTRIQGKSQSDAFTQLSGRSQPHAPSYQFNLGSKYRHPSGFYGMIEAQGMNAFYFDTTHNESSKPYQIWNARAGYEQKNWETYIWVKNLTNQDYATRGYYFANEPTYSITKQYIRLGDPRQIGITARRYF